MDKIPVGILGATGTVGQRFVQLLANHPWFEVTALAASDRSAGKPYAEACHWLLPTTIPDAVRDIEVQSIDADLDCRLVFSSLPSAAAIAAERRLAQAGYIVCSNASPHRMEPDVPLLIPEVNPEHTALLDAQKRQRGWKGAIVTSSNCSSLQLALALKPLQDAFGLRKVAVVTLQAVSGAGYPGVPSLDIIGNVIPFIGGEEEKMETETLKLLGTLEGERIADPPTVISAHCNRVPVRDGHTECVSVEFERNPDLDELIEVWESFRSSEQVATLPSTPLQPIYIRREADRPQPILDRDAGNGASVSVGRVRPCPLFHYKFVVLGHNTMRGAAGGSIHNAELLVAQERISG